MENSKKDSKWEVLYFRAMEGTFPFSEKSGVFEKLENWIFSR